MRPLKLTMQAFGPYAGSETIDFTELGNRTMFVISGKTGSGKTTIFDGISYAIYGKASGEDRNGPELRSQFAKDELLTEVSLEFSLRNKTYFITRSPQQEKKKERGDGFRTVNATAELYVIDQDGKKKILGSNVREVDEKIKEIILIDSNQFRQILMIPQGEFRKLLTSDSKDKELILQRLFHTEIYKRIEEKLKEEATSLKKTVEKQVELRSQELKKIFQHENEALGQHIEVNQPNDTIVLPLLKDVIELMESDIESVQKKTKEKSDERDEVQKEMIKGQAILELFKEKELVKTRRELLESQKPHIERQEEEYSLSQKATVLEQQEQLCHRLKRDSDQAKVKLESIQKEEQRLTLLLNEQQEQLTKEEAREPERKAASEKVNQLQNMKEDVEAYSNTEKQVLILEKKLNELQTNKEANQALLQQLEELEKKLLDNKEQLEKNQFRHLELDRELEKLAIQMDLMKKLELNQEKQAGAKTDLQIKKSSLDQAEKRINDKRDELLKLERQWNAGQAVLLASTLVEGSPCPVCGSEHHPAIASAHTDDMPNEETLNAKREQVSKLEQQKSKIEAEYYRAESYFEQTTNTLVELREEVCSKIEKYEEEQHLEIVKELEHVRAKLNDENRKIVEEMKQMDVIVERLTKTRSDLQVAKDTLEKIVENVQSITIEHVEKKTTLTRMTNVIPESLRKINQFELALKAALEHDSSLQQRLLSSQKQLQQTSSALATETGRLKDASAYYSEKEQELKLEREQFISHMNEQGFPTYQAYADAKRTDLQRKELEQKIRDYWEEFRSISDRFNELTEKLKDINPPNLEALEEMLQKLNVEYKQLNDQYYFLVEKKKENERIMNVVLDLNQSMKELEGKYKIFGDLYEISKGQNTYKVTFERFVLAHFLDDILREANSRLMKMTNGRYRLLRKTDRAKGNAQSGLELLVYDQYTGQERHVKTLSGGESFKAALSLALGLADVVQQHAGGVSLETMFIDEGFGTLDPESLDQAIEALMDIQSSGRLVGIISHVPELKERIDARLEVISSQTGSKTEFYFMN